MKKIKRQIYSAVAGVYAMLLLSIAAPALAATPANVNFSLNPSSGTVSNGQNLVIGVYENSGSDSVNAVQVHLAYPTSSLTLNSAAYDNSPFDGGPQGNESSGGPGTISLTRIFLLKTVNGNQVDGVTGSQLIATLYFTVTGSSGSINLTFNNCTAASPPDGTKANVTTQNGTYTFGSTNPSPTPPPPPPSPSPSPSPSPKPGSGGGSGGSSSSTTVRPAGNTTYTSNGGHLTISNITVSNLSGNTATVNWDTSAAATSEVDYGSDANSLLATGTVSGNSTSHSVSLASSNLQPNKTYYFVVKSADQAGNIVKSDVLSFQTTTASSGASKSSNQNKTTAIVAVSVITLIAIVGAVAIRGMHKRSLENQELASHVVSAPGTSVVNGNVTVTPDPKQTPTNPNGPKTG